MNNNIVPMDEGEPIEIIYSESDDDLPPPLIENNESDSGYIPNDYYAGETIFFTNNDQSSYLIENNEHSANLSQTQDQAQPNHLIIGQVPNMSQRISDYFNRYELDNAIFNSPNNIPSNTLDNYGQIAPTLGGVAPNNTNNYLIGLSGLLQQQMAFNLQHAHNDDPQQTNTTAHERIQSLVQNYQNQQNDVIYNISSDDSDDDMPELTSSVNTAPNYQFYGEPGQPPQQ